MRWAPRIRSYFCIFAKLVGDIEKLFRKVRELHKSMWIVGTVQFWHGHVLQSGGAWKVT